MPTEFSVSSFHPYTCSILNANKILSPILCSMVRVYCNLAVVLCLSYVYLNVNAIEWLLWLFVQFKGNCLNRMHPFFIAQVAITRRLPCLNSVSKYYHDSNYWCPLPITRRNRCFFWHALIFYDRFFGHLFRHLAIFMSTITSNEHHKYHEQHKNN